MKFANNQNNRKRKTKHESRRGLWQKGYGKSKGSKSGQWEGIMTKGH